MAQNNKYCMELPFNRNISYSQRLKAKEFWKFLDNECNLKPYQVPSGKTVSHDSDANQPIPVRTKGIWREQFKTFQEHGLDKVALAAYEKCRMCSAKSNYGSSYSTDTAEQSYEELLHDMEVFDKKLTTGTNIVTKRTKK